MMMNATCKDRERIFEDGTPGEWAALEAHSANCPVCAEELKAWKSLSVAAHRTRSCRRSRAENAESRAQELALLPAKRSFELANRRGGRIRSGADDFRGLDLCSLAQSPRATRQITSEERSSRECRARRSCVCPGDRQTRRGNQAATRESGNAAARELS